MENDFDALDNWEDSGEYEDIDLLINYSGKGTQFVTFMLAEEKYGLDILKVRELISYSHITRIPNMPNFLKGVLNLRGLVVPVVDLRKKFNMSAREYNKYTVIVILHVEKKLIGIIVDSVTDVIYLDPEQIQPTPEFSFKIDTAFVKGIGRFKEEMIILLNSDKLLSLDEMGLLP